MTNHAGLFGITRFKARNFCIVLALFIYAIVVGAVFRENIDIFGDRIDSCMVYVKAVFGNVHARVEENISVGYPAPHEDILLHLEGLEMFNILQGGIKNLCLRQAYWLNLLDA